MSGGSPRLTTVPFSSRIRAATALAAALVLAAWVGPVQSAFPGTNGLIAYTSDISVFGARLFTMDAAGGPPTQLPVFGSPVENPAWSPDGTRIAFSQAGTLFVIDPVDEVITPVIDPNAGGLDDYEPTWSPDGTMLAFSRRAGADRGIWRVNVDGTGLTRLTNRQDSDPAWSPDGGSIAFTRWAVTFGEVANSPGQDIYVMNPNGGGQIRLTGRHNAADPAWSPDGSEIAYVSREPEPDIYVLDPSEFNLAPRQVTFDLAYEFGPSWSPDGTRIVFERGRADGSNNNILTARADGSGHEDQLTSSNGDRSPDWQSVSAPAVQPTCSIGSTRVEETDAGTADATFEIDCDNPTAVTHSVDFATADGTAHASDDYTNTTGSFSVAPGRSHPQIHVDVAGDTDPEPHETFTVTLAPPPGVAIDRPTATATITDDDGLTVQVETVSVNEGDSGYQDIDLGVTLSHAADQPVSADFVMRSVAAEFGVDYYLLTTAGVVFDPGDVRKVATFRIYGDLDVEDDQKIEILPVAQLVTDENSLDGGIWIRDDDSATGNHPPVTVDDSVTVRQTNTARIDVMENDSDPDAGDTIHVISSTQPAHGHLDSTQVDTFDYTPTAGYLGPDEFTYTIADEDGLTATATVHVDVTAGLGSVRANVVFEDAGLALAEQACFELVGGLGRVGSEQCVDPLHQAAVFSSVPLGSYSVAVSYLSGATPAQSVPRLPARYVVPASVAVTVERDGLTEIATVNVHLRTLIVGAVDEAGHAVGPMCYRLVPIPTASSAPILESCTVPILGVPLAGFGGVMRGQQYGLEITNHPGNVVADAGQDGQAVGPFDDTTAVTSITVHMVDASPPNDDFADAEVLTDDSTEITGTVFAASRESGEPDHCNPGYPFTVWYRWTPDQDGLAIIQAPPTGLCVVAYEGNSLTTLTPVTPFSVGLPFSGLPFRAVAGTTYHVAIAGTGSTAGFTIGFGFVASPANDAFANAEVLTDNTSDISGDLFIASRENDEPTSCPPSAGSLWYAWTPDHDGLAAFSASTTAFCVELWQGSSLATLTPVATTQIGFGGFAYRVVAGTTYHLAVEGGPNGFASTIFTIHRGLQAAPANDDFVDAEVLTDGATAISGSVLAASIETGEPTCSTQGGSVWYEWTPTSDGIAGIASAPPGFCLGLWEGSTLGGLTPVDIHPGPFGSGSTFRVVAGTTYDFAVEGNPVGQTTSFSIGFGFQAAPANDDFADAAALTDSSTQVTGTAFAASRESGETALCPSLAGSVWYAWTPGHDGLAFIQTPPSGMCLGLLEGGSLGGLTPVDAHPFGLGGSSVFRAVAGTTYHLVVEGNDGPSTGFTLTFAFVASPGNDDFADAEVLADDSSDIVGNVLAASRENDEPTSCPSFAASVWYAWTPDHDGLAGIESPPPSFCLVVFEGNSIGSLTPVQNLSPLSGTLFRAVAGTTYHVAVAGGPVPGFGSVTSFTLHRGFQAAPANDDFADAEVVADGSSDITGSVLAASRESGEPTSCSSFAGNVWYDWTPDRDGTASIQAAPSGFCLALWQGTSLAGLIPVDATSVLGGFVFRVAAGTTYHYAVAGSPLGPTASFTIHRGFIALQTLSIGDATVTEGNSGLSPATFAITLSSPSSVAVTVDYATVEGDAKAPADYAAAANTVTFAPGQVSKSIQVAVQGDTLDEFNETFGVTLTNPSGASIADGSGLGTITDDDDAPTLAVNDRAGAEGDTGTTVMTFTVTMPAASGKAVSVNYATAPGTATAPADFAAASGTLTIPAGATSGTFAVTVRGDTLDELDETFTVNLSNPTAASVADGSGIGTIVDDDPKPVITSFSPGAVRQGETVTIHGSNLTGTRDVTFARGGGGTVPATTFLVVSDTKVTVIVPAGATTGRISVTTRNGSGTGPVDLLIKPTIDAFSPGAGPVGTIVTITGTGLTGATQVRFNGVLAINFGVNSDTRITAIVPTGASTGKITVVTRGGSDTSTNKFTVR